MNSRLARRPKLIEACATIARVVSHSGGGAAHTVGLMLRDPEFRATAIETARSRVALVGPGTFDSVQWRANEDVRKAAELLAPHSGARI